MRQWTVASQVPRQGPLARSLLKIVSRTNYVKDNAIPRMLEQLRNLEKAIYALLNPQPADEQDPNGRLGGIRVMWADFILVDSEVDHPNFACTDPIIHDQSGGTVLADRNDQIGMTAKISISKKCQKMSPPAEPSWRKNMAPPDPQGLWVIGAGNKAGTSTIRHEAPEKGIVTDCGHDVGTQAANQPGNMNAC
jgi:hypothetical protein